MVYNVKDYGAKGNGKSLDTEAIQNTIYRCNQDGGGIVYFPAGTFLLDSIELKSNITLKISAGAVLVASPDREHWPKFNYWGEEEDYMERYYYKYDPSISQDEYSFRGLIYGKNLKNISITGNGIIDGQGQYWWGRDNDCGNSPKAITKPKIIQMIDCYNITIRDIYIKNQPSWTIHLRNSNKIRVNGIKIKCPPHGSVAEVDTNEDNQASNGTDGINIDSCQDVYITSCFVACGDDNITLKAMGKQPTRDVIISDNIIGYGGGLTIGSETSASVKNIICSNNVFKNTNMGINIKTARGRGGSIENLLYSDFLMTGVREPVKIAASWGSRQIGVSRGKFKNPWTPEIKNISINNMVVKDCGPLLIKGFPEFPLKELSLNNIKIHEAVVEKDLISVNSVKSLEINNIKADLNEGKDFLNITSTDDIQISNFRIKGEEKLKEPVSFANISDLNIENSPEISLLITEFKDLEVEALEDTIPAHQPFSITVVVEMIKSGLIPVILNIDGEKYKEKYLWLDKGKQTVSFDEIRLYQAGKHLIEIGSCKKEIVVKPRVPQFEFSDLEVRPISLIEGKEDTTLLHASVPSLNEPQYILATVKNTGSSISTKMVKILVDGDEVDSKKITLTPGEEQKSIKFAGDYQFMESGRHQIKAGTINDTGELVDIEVEDIYIWNKYDQYELKSLKVSAGSLVKLDNNKGETYPEIEAVVTDTAYGREYKHGYLGSPIGLYINGKPVSYRWARAQKGKEVKVRFNPEDTPEELKELRNNLFEDVSITVGGGLSHFSYNTVKLSDTKIKAGRSIEVKILVTNKGETGIEPVKVYLDDKLSLIKYIAIEKNETKEVRIPFRCYQGGTHQLQIGDLKQKITVTPIPAKLKYISLKCEPVSLAQNNEYSIKVKVKNTGSFAESFPLGLKIGNEKVSKKINNISPGELRQVEFKYKLTRTGKWEVRAGDLCCNIVYGLKPPEKIADRSGDKYHGKIKGKLQPVAGKFGEAVKLDGKQGYIELPVRLNEIIKKEFSIMFWFKPPKDKWGPVTILGATKEPRYFFVAASNKGLQFFFKSEAGTSVRMFTPKRFYSEQWYHICVTGKFNSNGPHKMYINGREYCSNDTEIDECGLLQNLRIGLYSSDKYYVPLRGFYGTIDEFRIYNCNLTEDEIVKIYGQNSNIQQGQELRYSFDLPKNDS